MYTVQRCLLYTVVYIDVHYAYFYIVHFTNTSIVYCLYLNVRKCTLYTNVIVRCTYKCNCTLYINVKLYTVHKYTLYRE